MDGYINMIKDEEEDEEEDDDDEDDLLFLFVLYSVFVFDR